MDPIFDTLNITIYGDILLGDLDMATVQEVLDVVSATAVSITAIAADVQMLKDKISAGGVVSQADLDNIHTQVQAVADQAAALDATTP